ncbi:MAG: TatD family hydrolase [Kiritimatiellae bacterium]|nr:TatD family hydrolase [Kiritimatiellia bacterium]
MFDAHAHLQDQKLLPRLRVVLDSAVDAGVTAVCCCGTGCDDWEALAGLCRIVSKPVLVPAFGVHPWYCLNQPDDWLERLERMFYRFPAAALGEAGVDGLKRDIPMSCQRICLELQLDLAVRLKLPVVLHGARAWDELLDVLTPYVRNLPAVVLHGFGGSREQFAKFSQIGCYFSLGGAVCNPQAKKVRAIVAEIPDSQLLIETDSPDLLPYGGKALDSDASGRPINQPSNLGVVAETIASLRGISFDALSDLTAANARRVFM